jgi:CMP-2-keto-3-deoxyoctulosonic acid synthetase
MNESMSQVLKHLGVPFFGTHAALILPDHDSNGEVVSKAGEGSEGSGGEKVIDTQGDRPTWSPRVTGKELMELKRRMVAYLEDMYKG